MTTEGAPRAVMGRYETREIGNKALRALFRKAFTRIINIDPCDVSLDVSYKIRIDGTDEFWINAWDKGTGDLVSVSAYSFQRADDIASLVNAFIDTARRGTIEDLKGLKGLE